MRAMYFFARSASAMSAFRLMVAAKCLRAGTSGFERARGLRLTRVTERQGEVGVRVRRDRR